jgi:hypothetical protein
MKNLLIYSSPQKEFSKETAILVKIQIDNSLELGWKREDIILVTNFLYEYNGIESNVIERKIFYNLDMTSDKMLTILKILHDKLLDDKELYWYHDLDAYQLNKFTEDDLGMDDKDLGLTPYGYKPEWNCGGFFFKTSATDIFRLLVDKMLQRTKRGRADEQELRKIVGSGVIKEDRYKEMNVTYNFTQKFIKTNYARANKPLKVLHFHPWYYNKALYDTTLNMFMYGKNRLGLPLMDDRLIKIFNKYEIK